MAMAIDKAEGTKPKNWFLKSFFKLLNVKSSITSNIVQTVNATANTKINVNMCCTNIFEELMAGSLNFNS